MLCVHRHKIQIAHSFRLPTHQNLLWYPFLFVSRCESENIPAVVFGYEEIVFVSFIDHLDIRAWLASRRMKCVFLRGPTPLRDRLCGIFAPSTAPPSFTWVLLEMAE